MLYKIILFILILSCKQIEEKPLNIDVEIVEKSPKYRSSSAIVAHELKKLFYTQTPSKKCKLEFSITKDVTYQGQTAEMFFVNENLKFSTQYNLKCEDSTSHSGVITLLKDLTLAQEKTVSKYAGERHLEEQAMQELAKEIHHDITIFFMLHEK